MAERLDSKESVSILELAVSHMKRSKNYVAPGAERARRESPH